MVSSSHNTRGKEKANNPSTDCLGEGDGGSLGKFLLHCFSLQQFATGCGLSVSLGCLFASSCCLLAILLFFCLLQYSAVVGCVICWLAAVRVVREGLSYAAVQVFCLMMNICIFYDD